MDEGRAVCRYRRGQVLFQEGNPPHGVFCIKSGLVKLTRHGADGAEHIVGLSGPGDLVGHAAHLSDEPLDHGAEAATDIEVCQLTQAAFRAGLSRDGRLLRNTAGSVARELFELRTRWIERSEGTVPDRLLTLLRRLPRKKRSGEVTVEVPLSRQELASFLGTAPETVMRGLKKLVDSGLIENRGRTIRLVGAGVKEDADGSKR
jgi:CRP/FNR family transcriptional regulator